MLPGYHPSRCQLGSSHDLMQRRDEPFAEGHTAWIVRGVLRALDYMHTERKAIHRDIKAANVLVSHDAQVLPATLCDGGCNPL